MCLTAATLSGCSGTFVATVEPFCEAVRDVHVSKQDQLTEGTAKQIRANIEGRTRVCGPEPKPQPAPAAKDAKPAAVASAEKS